LFDNEQFLITIKGEIYESKAKRKKIDFAFGGSFGVVVLGIFDAVSGKNY
jgi:hypothetical protein